MPRLLERCRQDPVFLSQPTPTLLLDADFTVEAASASYLKASGRGAEELLGHNVFEAFPANPFDTAGGSTEPFVGSVEAVARTGRPSALGPLRYDVPDRRRPQNFVEKQWALVNAPVHIDGHFAGVMVRVEDITSAPAEVLGFLRASQAGRDDSDGPSAEEAIAAVGSLLATMETNRRLAAEVHHLRRALESRPTIDLAKGVIVGERGCTADEAFETLRQLSMNANVRVADVAAAIVYHAQHGQPGSRRPG